MKLIVSSTWFLSLCSAVAVGSQIRTTETETSLIQYGLEENEIVQKGDLRIVLVGKTGVGKSATGNTILGEEVFKSRFSFSSVTRDCKKEFRIINGRKISIIDTPGLFDTSLSVEEVEREIKTGISYSAPGPHAILIVLKLERYTKENADAIEYIERLYGKKALDYAIVVFTHGDLLRGQDIKTFVRSCPELRRFVRRCGGQYFAIDNNNKDSDQVMQLLHKIDEMVLDNGGEYYTNDMLQEAERAIEEEKQRILKENEEQRMREREDLENKLRVEELEKMRKETERILKESEEQRMRELEALKYKFQGEELENMRKEKERILKESEDERMKEFEAQKKKLLEVELEKMRAELAKTQEEMARMQAEQNNGFIQNIVNGVNGVVSWLYSIIPTL